MQPARHPWPRSGKGARLRIPVCGIIQFHSPRGTSKSRRDNAARIFARLTLVAGEETRSSADGQHAQVLPRADDARARPRPAPGWPVQSNPLAARVCMGTPLNMRIARTGTTFHRTTNPSLPATRCMAGSKIEASPCPPLRLIQPSRNTRQPARLRSCWRFSASISSGVPPTRPFAWARRRCRRCCLAGTRFLVCRRHPARLVPLARLAPQVACKDHADAGADRACCCSAAATLAWSMRRRRCPAVFASLVFAVTPLYVALIEMVLPSGEPLPSRGWLGLLLGFAGLAALLWPSLHTGLGGNRVLLCGHRRLLAGALFWALGSILVASRPAQGEHPCRRILADDCRRESSILLLGTALGQWPQFHLNAASVGSLAYLITGGSLLGYTRLHLSA